MPENLYATDRADFEHLLTLGYTEVEATRLVYMKNHVTEKTEYREAHLTAMNLNACEEI